MPDDKPSISSLSPEEARQLSEQRGVIESMIPEEVLTGSYSTTAGKLDVLCACLDNHLFRPRENELRALGVVLGDAFVHELGMEWAMVEDSYGRDPAVVLPGSSVVLFPMTLIRDRVAHDHHTELRALFESLASEIRAQVPYRPDARERAANSPT